MSKADFQTSVSNDLTYAEPSKLQIFINIKFAIYSPKLNALRTLYQDWFRARYSGVLPFLSAFHLLLVEFFPSFGVLLIFTMDAILESGKCTISQSTMPAIPLSAHCIGFLRISVPLTLSRVHIASLSILSLAGHWLVSLILVTMILLYVFLANMVGALVDEFNWRPDFGSRRNKTQDLSEQRRFNFAREKTPSWTSEVVALEEPLVFTETVCKVSDKTAEQTYMYWKIRENMRNVPEPVARWPSG